MPLKVLPSDLEAVLNLVRNNFKGCGVSMPYKEAVIPYLDEIVHPAGIIGAVNTILNNESRLIGYNTDHYGAKRLLKECLGDLKDREVLMLGAGGVAKAIAVAVKELGGVLTIANRTLEKSRSLSEKLGIRHIPWNNVNLELESQKYLFINATSIGFNDKEQIPIQLDFLSKFYAVMDVVVGDTKLIREARSQGKKVLMGKTMTVYQAAKQFYIYTGQELPESFIKKFMSES